MAGVSTCDIDPDAKPILSTFKRRQAKNIGAIVLKVDSKKKMIVIEETFEDTTVDEVVGELPSREPRYVVLSYVYTTNDGRRTYPQLFIFCSPEGCKPELQMMYATSKEDVVKAAGATKAFLIRNTEEFTEEFIEDKLKFFK